VVFDHLTYSVLQPVRHSVYHWFDPGQYGVFVFFLVSGYIVPASLERQGSVRGFWVSRVFRLYPLNLLLMVAVFVLVLLVCCGLTRRFIEAPMQRLGRRVAGRLDARFGPDVLRPRWPRRPRLEPAGEFASRR